MKKYCGALALVLTIWLATLAPISLAISPLAKPLDDTVTFHAGWVVPLEDKVDLTSLETQTIEQRELQATQRAEQAKIQAQQAKEYKAQKTGLIAAISIFLIGAIYLFIVNRYFNNWNISIGRLNNSFPGYLKVLLAKLSIARHRIQASNQTNGENLITLFGAFVLISVIGLIALQQMPVQYFGLAKWSLYLLVPTPLLIFWLYPKIYNSFNYPFILLSLALAGYSIAYSSSITGPITPLYVLCAITIVAWAWLFKGNFWPEIGLLVLAWFTQITLLNWHFFIDLLKNESLLTTVKASLVLIFLFAFLLQKPRSPTLSKTNFAWLLLISPAILYLSFRSDIFSTGGAIHHWAFYVGPIQAIRDGGWLLYDIPSQYGFLNLLLAAAIPVASAWQAFYIFQSILFAITAFLGIWILIKMGPNSLIERLGVSLLFLCALFFADQHWYGPQPFPSSSVVRFFPCYLLLFTSILSICKRHRTLYLSLSWILGILWSAEASLYCTIISAGLIIGQWLIDTKNNRTQTLVFSLRTMLLILAASFVSIYSWYLIKLDRPPHWTSFYEYAVGYASGYGYVPYPISGPGILLILLILSLGAMAIVGSKVKAISQYIPTLAAASACLWAISSYYLGRPMPQNITALFPLLVFCSLLGLGIAKQATQYSLARYLNPIVLPLFFLVLLPIISPNWYQSLSKSNSFSSDISAQLPNIDPALKQAIEILNPNQDIPISYYGDASALRPFTDATGHSNEKVWMISPLQMIEDPIPPERRKILIERLVCRTPYEKGIMIYEPGLYTQAFNYFLSVFNEYYEITAKQEIGRYTLFEFKKLARTKCGP